MKEADSRSIKRSMLKRSKKKSKLKELDLKQYLHYCSVSEISIVRSLCRESFADFCRELWNEVVPEQLHWNWHMDVVCNELQAVCERIFKWQHKLYDLFINVPPGTSKSTMGSIMLTPWAWTRMATFRNIGGSYDKDLSLEFGMKARRLVQSEKYQELFPEIQISIDQNAKSHFENVHGGVRYCTSTGASATGRHAHLITVDDPINPKGVRSEAEVIAANQWMRETLPSRCVDANVTVLCCIMQRLGVEDPTGERLSRSKIWVPEDQAIAV